MSIRLAIKYDLSDNSHSIDALLALEGQKDILAILKYTAKIIGKEKEIKFETEGFKEGSVEFWLNAGIGIAGVLVAIDQNMIPRNYLLFPCLGIIIIAMLFKGSAELKDYLRSQPKWKQIAETSINEEDFLVRMFNEYGNHPKFQVLQNQYFQRQIKHNAKNDKKVNNITLNFYNHGNLYYTKAIPKTDFHSYIHPIEPKSKIEHNQKIILQTIHLDETKKKNKNTKIIWRGLWKEKSIKFQIFDERFLNQIREINFKAGMYLIIDLEYQEIYNSDKEEWENKEFKAIVIKKYLNTTTNQEEIVNYGVF